MHFFPAFPLINFSHFPIDFLFADFLYEFDGKVRLESRTSIAEDWTDTTDVLGTAERQAWIMEGETLLAAKLELGPVQTLAHQDASGNWVLNDPPPNKALELLKCQRYFCKFSGRCPIPGPAGRCLLCADTGCYAH